MILEDDVRDCPYGYKPSDPCDDCEGTGNEDCPECDGSGSTECGSLCCAGDHDCGHCDASGSVRCKACHGSGLSEKARKQIAAEANRLRLRDEGRGISGTRAIYIGFAFDSLRESQEAA